MCVHWQRQRLVVWPWSARFRFSSSLSWSLAPPPPLTSTSTPRRASCLPMAESSSPSTLHLYALHLLVCSPLCWMLIPVYVSLCSPPLSVCLSVQVKLTVARMPLTVKVSQFGFEPFVCEVNTPSARRRISRRLPHLTSHTHRCSLPQVVGSAAAGITREAAMAALHADLITAEPDSPRGQLPPPPPETTTATFPASSPQRRLGVTTSTTGSKQSLADVKARRSQRKAARREAEVLASTLQGRADKKKLTRAPRGVGSGAVHDPGEGSRGSACCVHRHPPLVSLTLSLTHLFVTHQQATRRWRRK